MAILGRPLSWAVMTLGLRVAPRVVAIAAWTLALTVAAGVAGPRPRAGGRERVARAGIARAGTLRANESRGWVAPDADHPLETCAIGAGQGRSNRPMRTADPPGGHPALTVAVRIAGLPASPSVVSEESSSRLPRWLARPAAGRGPPLS